jgi:hypothetical protein
VAGDEAESGPGAFHSEFPGSPTGTGRLSSISSYGVQPKSPAKKTGGWKGQQITVKGEVLEVQDEFYTVKDHSGREVRMHVDQDTKMSGKVQKGDKIQAKVTQANHAQSIEKAD